MNFNWRALVLACVVTLSSIFVQQTAHATDVLLIVDSSASMSKSTSDGVRRIDAAKQSLRNILPLLRDDQVGLVSFGHRVPANKPGCCGDIESTIPIGPFSASRFSSAVDSLQPLGNTPLARSLVIAKDLLISREKDTSKAIIVLTDGNDTCNGDPQAIAAELARMGINVKIHVVGFAVKPKEVAQLRGIAQQGNGMYVMANDANSLKKVLTEVVVEVQNDQPAPSPTRELSRIEKALVARLSDADFSVRKQAANTLRKLKAVATAPDLAKRVHDDLYVSYSKDAILNALKALAPERVEESLWKAMDSKNIHVRFWATKNLIPVGGGTSHTKLSRLDQALVNRLTDKDFTLRKQAANGLSQRKAGAAVPHLVKRVQDDLYVSYSKDAVLNALKVLGPERVEDALLKAMESKNSDVRNWATAKLVDTDS